MSRKHLLASALGLALLVVPLAQGKPSQARPSAAVDGEITGSYVLTPTGIEATLTNSGGDTYYYNAGRIADGRPVTGATFNGIPCTSSVPSGWSFDCGPYEWAPAQTVTIDVTVPGLHALLAGGVDDPSDLEVQTSKDRATYCCKSRISRRPSSTPPPPPPPPPSTTPPNPSPICSAGVQQLKHAWKPPAKKRSLSAGVPSNALQGQCTLPPRGPCKRQQGALLDGGPKDDTLVGTPLSDTLHGLEGNDNLDGKDDNDLLVGGPGRDTLEGGPCDDVLFSSGSDHDASWDGGPGQDVLNGSAVTMTGGPDDDYIVNGFPRRGTTDGGPGNDQITVTGEEATITGGTGKDVIYAVNRSADKIDCGPGADTLYADQQDVGHYKNCEKVIIK